MRETKRCQTESMKNLIKPDVDNPENISLMVSLFYDALLADDLMAPLFLEVAAVDLKAHLPTISRYWQKMLLGDTQYHNNTMARHRVIHRKHAFEEIHFQRWLDFFMSTLDQHFTGPYTDKARRIAINVIKNMKKQFLAA